MKNSELLKMHVLLVVCLMAAVADSKLAVEKNIAQASVEPDAPYRVMCYYANYVIKRPGIGNFTVNDIDPTLCSHIHFAFAQVRDLTLAPTMILPLSDFEHYAQLNALKETNPGLRTLLSVGGAIHPCEEWDKVVESVFNMETFISNCIGYIRRHNFDGIDLDWEFPAPHQTEQYTELLRRFRVRINEESEETHQEALLLAVVLNNIPDGSYDFPALGSYIDYANVMTYHLHGAWKDETGMHSALYQGETEHLSQEECVHRYRLVHFPMNKFFLGVPTFGVSFTLASANQHDVGDRIIGAGPPSNYTGDEGVSTYYEICTGIRKDEWTSEYENSQEAAYAYSERWWVGYDNPDSVFAKKQFVLQQELGGMFFWEIAMDDFRNLCGDGPYPMLTQAQLPERPPTPTPEPGLPECSYDGQHIPHPTNCSLFYRCFLGEYYLFRCPYPLHFDPRENACNWPDPSICADEHEDTPRCSHDGQLFPHTEHCHLFLECRPDGMDLRECPEGLNFNPISNSCSPPDPDICIPTLRSNRH